MKNLIAELLVKLAEKEEASKDLVAQIEALEIVVTALLRNLDESTLKRITQQIEGAMGRAANAVCVANQDAFLLETYVQKLLTHPRT